MKVSASLLKENLDDLMWKIWPNERILEVVRAQVPFIKDRTYVDQRNLTESLTQQSIEYICTPDRSLLDIHDFIAAQGKQHLAFLYDRFVNAQNFLDSQGTKECEVPDTNPAVLRWLLSELWQQRDRSKEY